MISWGSGPEGMRARTCNVAGSTMATVWSSFERARSVMVIKRGKVVLAKGYGLANVEERIACGTNTNFRLASVTKQFTAMTVMILAERGKLSLDERLTDC